jgi:hypothetical protein
MGNTNKVFSTGIPLLSVRLSFGLNLGMNADDGKSKKILI